nr:hypothetical protein [Herpetosiphonaceae bacterium]
MCQRPDATQVAGYTTWQRLGRQVKQGEHGIAILAPRPYRMTESNEQTGEEAVTRQGCAFRTAFVFDIGQTEGSELPILELATLTGDDGDDLYAALFHFAQDEGLTVTNHDPRTTGDDNHSSYKGYYNRAQQLIFVKRNAPTQMLKTLIHELAHHLDEDLITSPRQEQETVAEATAFVVAAHADIDTSAYSFPYVAHWTRRQDGFALIKKVMGKVQRIAHHLIDALESGTGDDPVPMPFDPKVGGINPDTGSYDTPTDPFAPISLPTPQPLLPAA